MALLHLILPYTYRVYSDFVTSSVKSDIKLLNTEELVSVCVYYSKMGKWHCCSTSRFASIFDVLLPIWILVDGEKHNRPVYSPPPPVGRNQQSASCRCFCFLFSMSSVCRNAASAALHGQHPSLCWECFSFLERSSGSLAVYCLLLKGELNLVLLQFWKYQTIFLCIEIICVFIHPFCVEQDRFLGYKSGFLCTAVGWKLSPLLWEYVK